MKIPDSTVPEDFPPKIWKKYSVELSTPVAALINSILNTGKWPSNWKTEFVTIIPKQNEPKDKGDLRNISLTLFVSKLSENIIYDLLISHWGNKIDSGQFGGRKGYSVTLYLIQLVDFILKNLEKSKFVILCLIDITDY